jgi:hypothetical protein
MDTCLSILLKQQVPKNHHNQDENKKPSPQFFPLLQIPGQ